MKPILLKITGINSFFDEEEIDFSKIIDKGIFGIFGVTGSGKSSIIDSITLALYGKMNRYDGKNGNREFININKSNAKVFFKFSIKNGKEDRTYTVVRNFKKDAKGSAKAANSRLSFTNHYGEEEIIADKTLEVSANLEKIIGLNYDDFIRSVVLPQGKFSEFLMLENKDKRSMLERIFGLEKYGTKLSEKINLKKKNQEDAVKQLQSEIGTFEGIDSSNLAEKKEQLKQQTNAAKNNKNKIEQKQKALKIVEQNLKLKTDLEHYKNKLDELKTYSSKVEEWEIKLCNAKKVDLINPFLDELKGIKDEAKNLAGEHLSKEKEHESLKAEFENIFFEYENIKAEREIKEPKLRETKAKLEQAIPTEKEITKLSEEIEKLEKSLAKIDAEFNDLITQIFEDEATRAKYLKKIEKTQDLKNQNKIDIKFKNDIENAAKLEEKHNELNQEISSKSAKLSNFKKDLKESEKQKENFKARLKKLDENYKEIDKKIENLHSKVALDSAKISEKEKKLFVLNSELEIAIKKDAEMVNLKLKESEIQASIDCLEEKIKKLKEKQDEVNANLAKIDALFQTYNEETLINKLAKRLANGSACFVCGSTSHPSPANIIIDEISSQISEEREILNRDFNLIDTKLNDQSQIKAKCEFELSGIRQNIFELEIYFKKYDIQKEGQKIKELEQKLNLSKDDFEKDNIKLKNLKETAKATEEEKTKSNIELTKANEATKNIDKIIFELEKELEEIKIGRGKIEKELTLYKEKLKIQKFHLEYENIKLSEEKYQKYQAEEEKMQKEMSVLTKKLEDKLQLKNKLFNEKSKEETLIKEKSENKINLENKIKGLSEKGSIEEHLKEVEKNLDYILQKEKILAEKHKNIEHKKRNAETEKSNIASNIKILKEILDKKEKEFLKKMKESHFSSIDEMELNFLTKEKQDFFTQKIQSFKEKIVFYNFNIEKLEKDLENIDLDTTEKEFEDLSRNINSLKEKEEENIKSITKLKIDIENTEKHLKTKGELLEKLKTQNYKLDLLTELASLNKGGVFVEYVAINQLKQIVFDAGQRLKAMSGNKFSLELKNSDFIVKDYHNGGVTRSAKSLSGGEVFMTSLSLALALSSKIQLTNQAPLEIFFLDEGFGTLDNNLLDTVISTLEKLQTQNISVGVITHIEDLKNRIGSKILVEFNEGDLGAKITLE